MSELISELQSSDAESDPDPPGHERYINDVLEVTHRFQDGLRYTHWESDSWSTIALRPSKIRSKLSRSAFLNYVNLSVDERFQLEAAASTTMSRIDGMASRHDMKVMINHVPLLFDDRGGAIIGRRNDDAREIVLESDVLDDPIQYRVLLGGLATVLFYADYPRLLPPPTQTVE
jgi:hypothetical protein